MLESSAFTLAEVCGRIHQGRGKTEAVKRPRKKKEKNCVMNDWAGSCPYDLRRHRKFGNLNSTHRSPCDGTGNSFPEQS